MRRYAICIFIFLLNLSIQAQEFRQNRSRTEIMSSLSESNLSQGEKEAVTYFIEALETSDKAAISNSMSYPIQREYPLPPIRNEKEFLQCYDTCFAPSFISSLSDGEWDSAGWRGIMYNNGEIWGDIDENGRLVIRSIFTASVRAQLDKCIREQKLRLHKSVRNFSAPLLWLKSASLRIRIDELSNGSVRYAGWSASDDISSAPELVIRDGTRQTDGSMSVSHYEFCKSGYRYIIYEDTASDTYPYHIEILDGTDGIILSEGAVIEYAE